ncbi:ParB/RepB/Spo0J family partition protein [Tepidimicrobium xylanilyticum]|uniref:Chromosome partitioning protein, ParB family n=1 Tax=Tepidimicrobium xylanilyticum TaxID=1123352 RepID=A0A1H3AJA3_9FIRM|nr:ParB/RepB/Spo0J family partition protein [Tepidimicrobium xylanilyticum]SDX29792.1 chromosome partitioning protein, ParB family [Tepidimicrobium xylanilyticum]
MTKKRGLGKGLAALIPNEPIIDLIEEDKEANLVKNIDISSIFPNKEQPRKEFDDSLLEELKESIKQHGVLQPIIVRERETGYEIVAGERRWRAAKTAGLKEIPCVVMEIDDEEAVKLALIENLQRDDLNPVEEANAFKKLIEDYNLTHEEVAKSLGKSRSYITNSIRLLNLDKEIIELLEDGQITSGHGRALLSIKDSKERKKIAKQILEDKLNVRDTEKIVKGKRKKKSIKKKEEDLFVKEVEEKLMNRLGTKVTLDLKKDKGTIQIEFYGDEDLERILELIIG